MVKGTLAGVKTQTRRTKGLEDLVIDEDSGYVYLNNNKIQLDIHTWKEQILKYCPLGQIGDILYVRENWRVHSWCPEDGEMEIGFDTDDEETVTCYELDDDMFNRLWEQSCGDLAEAGYEIGPDESYGNYDVKALRLRPSIHMPKEAARIWLEIKSIRVERLNDITEEDAIDEGIEPLNVTDTKYPTEVYYKNYGGYIGDKLFPVESFKSLWTSINGEGSWELNPWVWVVEFELIDKPDEDNKTAQSPTEAETATQ